jgi:hypothetical protein
MNTSVLTEMGWLRELLTGHPVRFYDAFGMPKHVFYKLVRELELHAGLKHSKHICAEEQVAIFLHLSRAFAGIFNFKEAVVDGLVFSLSCLTDIKIYGD